MKSKLFFFFACIVVAFGLVFNFSKKLTEAKSLFSLAEIINTATADQESGQPHYYLQPSYCMVWVYKYTECPMVEPPYYYWLEESKEVLGYFDDCWAGTEYCSVSSCVPQIDPYPYSVERRYY